MFFIPLLYESFLSPLPIFSSPSYNPSEFTIIIETYQIEPSFFRIHRESVKKEENVLTLCYKKNTGFYFFSAILREKNGSGEAARHKGGSRTAPAFCPLLTDIFA
jgi:hypothetical protein